MEHYLVSKLELTVNSFDFLFDLCILSKLNKARTNFRIATKKNERIDYIFIYISSMTFNRLILDRKIIII